MSDLTAIKISQLPGNSALLPGYIVPGITPGTTEKFIYGGPDFVTENTASGNYTPTLDDRGKLKVLVGCEFLTLDSDEFTEDCSFQILGQPANSGPPWTTILATGGVTPSIQYPPCFIGILNNEIYTIKYSLASNTFIIEPSLSYQGSILRVIPDIDLTQSGEVVLVANTDGSINVGPGIYLYADSISLSVTDASGLSVPSEISIGPSGDNNGIVDDVTLTGFDTTGLQMDLSLLSPRPRIDLQGGEDLILNVITPATASSLTVNANILVHVST
jgi:hypothetical protein